MRIFAHTLGCPSTAPRDSRLPILCRVRLSRFDPVFFPPWRNQPYVCAKAAGVSGCAATMSVYQRPATRIRKRIDISKRRLGVSPAVIADPRASQRPPSPDQSVLVHDCFDQAGGESKPGDCGCNQRISHLDAAALIRHGKADALAFVRYGKTENRRDSIVLRRGYVTERLLKAHVDPSKLLPKI